MYKSYYIGKKIWNEKCWIAHDLVAARRITLRSNKDLNIEKLCHVATQNSPHTAMNIANSTVPLLSNSRLTCRQTRTTVSNRQANIQLCPVNALMYLGIRAGIG